jgi:hypothetical protein
MMSDKRVLVVEESWVAMEQIRVVVEEMEAVLTEGLCLEGDTVGNWMRNRTSRCRIVERSRKFKGWILLLGHYLTNLGRGYQIGGFICLFRIVIISHLRSAPRE